MTLTTPQTTPLPYRFLKSGGKDKVEDISGVVHSPELPQHHSPDAAVMDWGQEVAEELAQLLVELAAGADGVALPLQTQGDVLGRTERH